VLFMLLESPQGRCGRGHSWIVRWPPTSTSASAHRDFLAAWIRGDIPAARRREAIARDWPRDLAIGKFPVPGVQPRRLRRHAAFIRAAGSGRPRTGADARHGRVPATRIATSSTTLSAPRAAR